MNILITGAAQGIGAAISNQLVSKENTLILVDYQKDKLADFANKIRNNCKEVIELAGDLTNESFIKELQQYIKSNKIDVLINNAGIAHSLKLFEELSEDDYDLSFKLNVKAPFQLIQAAIPGMKANGSGIILNVASRANIYGYYKMAIYSATKAAITSLSGTVSLENKEIKAVTVIPGRTNTSMQASLRGADEAAKAQSPDYVGEVVSKVIRNEIKVSSGDAIIIDFGNYEVVSKLDREALHRNMH